MTEYLELPTMEALKLDRRGSEPFVQQSFLMRNKRYGPEMLTALDDFRTAAMFTDVVLCVKEGERTKDFHCHRSVLAASSAYFRAMFSSELREGSQSRTEIYDISVSTLQTIIEYAYRGEIEISIDNAEELLGASTLFQYPSIEEACCDFLTQHLHPSNVLRIEQFAQLYSCDKLVAAAHTYALDSFSTVIEFDEFLELPLACLVSYLASDMIHVLNEETVYKAAMCWIRHDTENRDRHLPTLLEKIRLTAVDSQYLYNEISEDPLIQASSQSIKIIDQAKEILEKNNDQTNLLPRRMSMRLDSQPPRPSTLAKEILISIGGINEHNIFQTVEIYDPSKDRWQQLADLPVKVSYCSVSALCNNVYVCGGIVDDAVVSSVWCFEPQSRVWTDVNNMLLPRARHTSSSYKQLLYVLGGVTSESQPSSSTSAADTIECYNKNTQQWTYVGFSPFPRRMSHTAASGNNLLLEVGGTQGSSVVMATLECYQCAANSVVYSGEQFVLPNPIKFGKIIVINQIFYILWEDTCKLISLNPEKRVFRRLADMHQAHICSGVTLVAGKIYVIGGYSDGKPTRVCECYDPATDTWTIVKRLIHNKAHHSCVTLQMCS